MKIGKQLFVFFTVTIIFLGIGAVAYAQTGHNSAASLGMGATGTAHLDAYHANFANPANLMLNSDSKPSFALGVLGGVSGSIGGPLFNISEYNSHFTSGEVVTPAALDDWFGTQMSNSRRLGGELDVIPLAASWRGEKMAFSLALRNRALFNSTTNRGYAELVLTGATQQNFSNPTPVNFSSKTVLFSEISAGFSYELLEIQSLLGFAENVKVYAGIAPKYIVPQYTAGIDFNSTLQVTGNEIIHDFQYTFQSVGSLANQFQSYYQDSQSSNFDGAIGDYVEPEANDLKDIRGSGFGFDLGGTIEMDLAGPMASAFSWIPGTKKLTLALSLTDIGAVKYTEQVGTFSADETFNWDGVDFEDGFDDALADSIAKEIYLNYQPGNKEEITQKLPTKINFGSHMQLGKLSLALDLTKGFNEAGMNSRRMAIGVGTEYKFFGFLPLRAGYRTGGLTSSSFTLGTGLEFKHFEFTVGVLSEPNSDKRGSSVAGAWSGLVFRF